MTQLCVLPTCRIRGRHLPGCQDESCAGCLPRVAEEGVVCAACESRAERALAEIQRLVPDARAVAYGEVRRTNGGGSNKPGSRSPGNDDALDAIDATHNQLARTNIKIAQRRGMRLHVPCMTDCVHPTPSQAHCSVCHETFAGPTLFDAHRRGDVDNRYCLDPTDMTDRGYPLRKDARGVWRSGAARPETESGEPQSDQETNLVAEPTPDHPEPAETFTGGQP